LKNIIKEARILIRDNRGIDYTLDQAVEDIKEALKDLEDVTKNMIIANCLKMCRKWEEN